MHRTLVFAAILALASGPALADWHEGTFRQLPRMSGDLEQLVQGLNTQDVPRGTFRTLDAPRAERFDAFMQELFSTLEATRANQNTGDWCRVRQRAATAGYELRRYHDTVTGRWFLYGLDVASQGQAFFFINPSALHETVIEVPHAGHEQGIALQGARVFKALGARALLVNGDHRCSLDERQAGQASECGGETQVCSQFRGEQPPVSRDYPLSDVAHDTANTFHRLHRFLNGRAATRFVQLHGKGTERGTAAEVADSGPIRDASQAVSSVFARRLRTRLADGSSVRSCQELGVPEDTLCAQTNVQGRLTNGVEDACRGGNATGGNGRFLHVEQNAALRDTRWDRVCAALSDTWALAPCDPGCSMGACGLGQPQAFLGDLACPQSLTPIYMLLLDQ